MILRHRVALNEAQLDELDSRVMVCAIEESAAAETIGAVSRFGGVGQRMTNRHRESLDVVVKFALRIKKDMEARQELFARVIGWAMAARDGAWLTVGHKPGKRLWTQLVALPPEGDQATWNGEYSLTFRAYGVPHWQDITPTTLIVGSTKGLTREIPIEGTADSVLQIIFENLSGMEIATVGIQAESAAGVNRIELNSLGLKAGETLVIGHDNEGLLHIRIRSVGGSSSMGGVENVRSVLHRRTAESADDLWVGPGTCRVTFAAQRAGKLTVYCYGRYA